jgi:hypothetical protein
MTSLIAAAAPLRPVDFFWCASVFFASSSAMKGPEGGGSWSASSPRPGACPPPQRSSPSPSSSPGTLASVAAICSGVALAMHLGRDVLRVVRAQLARRRAQRVADGRHSDRREVVVGRVLVGAYGALAKEPGEEVQDLVGKVARGPAEEPAHEAPQHRPRPRPPPRPPAGPASAQPPPRAHDHRGGPAHVGNGGAHGGDRNAIVRGRRAGVTGVARPSGADGAGLGTGDVRHDRRRGTPQMWGVRVCGRGWRPGWAS